MCVCVGGGCPYGVGSSLRFKWVGARSWRENILTPSTLYYHVVILSHGLPSTWEGKAL